MLISLKLGWTLWVIDRRTWSLAGVWAEFGWSTTCRRCWTTCSRWRQTRVRRCSMLTPSTRGSVSCSCCVVWLAAYSASERRLLLPRKSVSSSLNRWTCLVCLRCFVCYMCIWLFLLVMCVFVEVMVHLSHAVLMTNWLIGCICGFSSMYSEVVQLQQFTQPLLARLWDRVSEIMTIDPSVKKQGKTNT